MNLQEIKEREAKATKGPWFARKGNTCHHVCSESGQFDTGCINFDGKSPHNADFIAHAREDIPALVAEIERLQVENARLKIEVEELETIADTVKRNDLIRQLVLGEVDSQIENLLTLRGIEEVS